MLDVRSRAGIVAVATGAALALGLPVAAAGQAPKVGDVVGGVKDTVKKAAPAPPVHVPAPPVKLPAPAPAPKSQGSRPAPVPPAHGRSKTSAPAPPAHGRSKPPAQGRSKAPAPRRRGRGERLTSASGASESPSAEGEGGGSDNGRANDGGGSKDGGGVKDGSGVKNVNVSQDDGGAPTDVEIADQTADAPVEASPSTLPFTGLGLALVAALGLVALFAGTVLRRGARGAR